MIGGNESYEGTVPAAVGTGPKNLPKTSTPMAPVPPEKSHFPDDPNCDMSLAGAGYPIPDGGAGGIMRADSTLIKAPTVLPNGSSRGPRPNDIPVHADGASTI